MGYSLKTSRAAEHFSTFKIFLKYIFDVSVSMLLSNDWTFDIKELTGFFRCDCTLSIFLKSLHLLEKHAKIFTHEII